jgi:predicted DNA-binding protein
MKRTTVWLSDQQVERLAALSKKTGIKTAELIRRLIDGGLDKEDGRKESRR